jgi:RNA polymerase sigma-70 factor (ECF subfamily)
VSETDLDALRSGDETAFTLLVERHRGELLAHCYRMLGSVADAEDALQEALIGAWRGLASFEGRSSLRTWLFRIATHAALRVAEVRRRRITSVELGPPLTQTGDLGVPVTGELFVEPYIETVVETAPEADPVAAYERRESVEIAYVAALQHLPPNQRAVLLLREVLGFTAAEVAEMVETSTASVNSALQRARAGIATRVPDRTQQDELAALGARGRDRLVEDFAAAWEASDIDTLTTLLTEDVRFTMPPLPAWFDGLPMVRRFISERVFATPWRLVPIAANGQPAFACYQDTGDGLRLGAVNVLSLRDGRVNRIGGFVDPSVLGRLGLPVTPPA